MTANVFLTIDDSPSPVTDRLTDYLKSQRIPALLFCRGDRMEANPGPLIRAIRKGFVIGNHAYSHRPAGELGPDGMMDEIERTEELIEAANIEARVKRPGYYFRFPYVDRGGGDRLEQRFQGIIEDVQKGKAVALHNGQGKASVEVLQDFLQGSEFTQPFPGVNHPLYQHKEIAEATDCLFTFTSGDWMMSARHKGKWPYKTLEDLEKRMEDDPWVLRDGNTGIVLFHDQEEIIDATIHLIGYMKSREVKFLDCR